jgi:hypothetical protein
MRAEWALIEGFSSLTRMVQSIFLTAESLLTIASWAEVVKVLWVILSSSSLFCKHIHAFLVCHRQLLAWRLASTLASTLRVWMELVAVLPGLCWDRSFLESNMELLKKDWKLQQNQFMKTMSSVFCQQWVYLQLQPTTLPLKVCNDTNKKQQRQLVL